HPLDRLVALWIGHFHRGQVDQFSIVELHLAIGSVAETTRAPGDDLEHWLDVGLGLADSTQYLTCGRLPGDGLCQFGVARFQLLEQPDVLDRDDGLVGERLEELDLLVRKESGFSLTYDDDAETTVIT